LQIRSRIQTRTDDVVVGIYYRPTDQEEEIDKAFFRQLEKNSQSEALVLRDDINQAKITGSDP